MAKPFRGLVSSLQLSNFFQFDPTEMINGLISKHYSRLVLKHIVPTPPQFDAIVCNHNTMPHAVSLLMNSLVVIAQHLAHPGRSEQLLRESAQGLGIRFSF